MICRLLEVGFPLDRQLMEQRSEAHRRRWQEELQDLERTIPLRLLPVCRDIAGAGERGVEWCDMGLPIKGDRKSLLRRGADSLRRQEPLLESLAPSVLLRLAVPENEPPVPEIVDAFWQCPHLLLLSGGETVVVAQALRGIKKSNPRRAQEALCEEGVEIVDEYFG